MSSSFTTAPLPSGPYYPHPTPAASYWHERSLSPAAAVGSDADAPPEADYVIVGSGVSGAMLAWNLLAGLRAKGQDGAVVVLEAREAVGGATGRNGGHTKAGSYRSYLANKQAVGKEEALRIALLEAANIRCTHAFAARHGIDYDGAACRTLDCIYDPATWEDAKRGVAELIRDLEELGPLTTKEDDLKGVTEADRRLAMDYTILSPDVACQEYGVARQSVNPVLDRDGLIKATDDADDHHATHVDTLRGAIAYPAGRLSAYRFTTAVLALLRATYPDRFALHTHHTVTSITPAASGTSAHRLHTSRGTSILARRATILATNAYTPALLPALRNRIVPLRGQISALRPAGPRHRVPPNVTFSFMYGTGTGTDANAAATPPSSSTGFGGPRLSRAGRGYEYMIPRPRRPTDESDDNMHVIIGGGLGRQPGGLTGVPGGAGPAPEWNTVDDGAVNERIGRYLREAAPAYFGPATWGDGEEMRQPVVKEWTGIMGVTADGLPFVGAVEEEGGKGGLWVQAGFNGSGMVLCLKCAEALAHRVLGGSDDDLAWFPRSFLLTKERLDAGVEGKTDF